MDTASQPGSPAPQRRRRSRVRLALSVLGILLLGTITVLILATGPTPTIVWLPQSGPTQSAPPGKLAQLTAKFKNLTAPIWRPFRRNRRQIQINSTLMKLAPNSDAAASFGTPISTNANGLRAWVLDASQLRAFVEPFDARTGKIGSTSYAIVFDGQQANRTQISSIVPVNGTNDFINLVTSFVPKIVSGSVQLTVGITWIGGNITPSNANLVACRALLPNNGALVIDCGSAKAADGKNYWFIFCPIIQEPNAKPRKR